MPKNLAPPSDKELFDIVLGTMKASRHYMRTICEYIAQCRNDGTLTDDQSIHIRWLFYSHKPTASKHSQFYYDPLFINDGIWWKISEDGFNERKRFLQYLIDTLPDGKQESATTDII